MSENSLSVNITANIIELQAKLAIAKAEMTSWTGSLRTAAKEASSTGIGGTISAEMTQAAEGVLKARQQVASLEDQLGKAGVHVRGIREINAAIHELASGNVGNLPATFARLSETFGGLGIAGVGAVAGVVALGAAFYELAVHEREAAEAAETARGALAFQGINESAAQVNAWVAQVAALPGVSEKAASAYVQAFGSIRYGTDALKAEFLDLVPVLQKQFGEEGPKQAAKLAAAFNDLKGKGASTLEEFGAAPPVMEKFYAALANDDRAAAFKILLDQAVDNLKATDAAFDHSAVTARSFWENFSLGMIGTAGNAELLIQAIDQMDASKVKKVADDLAKASQAPTNKPQLPTSDEAFRAQLEALKANTQQSQEQILNAEIAAYGRRITELKHFGQDTQAAENERLALIAERNRAAGADLVTQARDQISQINAATNIGAVQKLEQEKQVWATLLTNDHLTYDQRLAAQKSFNDASAALERQRKTETEAIAKSNADTDIAISRLQLEAKKSLLAEEFNAKQITAQQEFDQLRDITKQLEKLDEDALQKRLDDLKHEPVQTAEVYNEIRLLKAKLTADLAAYDKQEQLDAQRSAQDQARAWKDALNEITSSEQTFLGDYLTGRKTAAQSAIAIADDLALKEIQNDAKYLTQKLFLSSAELAADKSAATGGLLVHLFSNAQKLTSTISTETGESAAVSAGAATRASVTMSATAAEHAAAAEMGSKTVLQDAAKAYSGAYSAVVGIPYVGPVLAPIAGGVAYAAVAAYETLASASGGAVVPSDNMLFNLHKDEWVLPSKISTGLQGLIDGGGGAGGISVGGDLNVHTSMPGGAVSQNAMVGALTRAVRNGNPAIRSALR
jgi:hypothetical protein